MFYRKWSMFRDLDFIERVTSGDLQCVMIEAYFVSPDGFSLDMTGGRWYNLIH